MQQSRLSSAAEPAPAVAVTRVCSPAALLSTGAAGSATGASLTPWQVTRLPRPHSAKMARAALAAASVRTVRCFRSASSAGLVELDVDHQIVGDPLQLAFEPIQAHRGRTGQDG
jgi:hypothetical protein